MGLFAAQIASSDDYRSGLRRLTTFYRRWLQNVTHYTREDWEDDIVCALWLGARFAEAEQFMQERDISEQWLRKERAASIARAPGRPDRSYDLLILGQAYPEFRKYVATPNPNKEVVLRHAVNAFRMIAVAPIKKQPDASTKRQVLEIPEAFPSDVVPEYQPIHHRTNKSAEYEHIFPPGIMELARRLTIEFGARQAKDFIMQTVLAPGRFEKFVAATARPSTPRELQAQRKQLARRMQKISEAVHHILRADEKLRTLILEELKDSCQ